MKAYHAIYMTVVLSTGCSSETNCPSAALKKLDRTPAFAVVTSDYQSTAIALLDEKGDCFTEAWIDSGTTRPGLTTTLSGDVTLASGPMRDDALYVVDRFGTDVITRVPFSNPSEVRQFLTQIRHNEGQSGYRPNPRDVARVDGMLWVTRYEPNPRSDAIEFNLGNDIIIINPVSSEISTRVDLTSLNRSEGNITFFARPDRLITHGEYVLVGLGYLSADFRHTGMGGLAVVDSRTFVIQSIQFDRWGLRNCGELTQGDDNLDAKREFTAWAVCTGVTFSSNAERRSTAGVVKIKRQAQDYVIEAVWLAKDHPEVCVPGNGIVPLSEHTFAIPCWGDIDASTSGDTLIFVNTLTGVASLIYAAQGDFVLGSGVFDGQSKTLFIPEADAGVLRFRVSGDSAEPNFTMLPRTDTSPCRKLPAREVRKLH